MNKQELIQEIRELNNLDEAFHLLGREGYSNLMHTRTEMRELAIKGLQEDSFIDVIRPVSALYDNNPAFGKDFDFNVKYFFWDYNKRYSCLAKRIMTVQELIDYLEEYLPE